MPRRRTPKKIRSFVRRHQAAIERQEGQEGHTLVLLKKLQGEIGRFNRVPKQKITPQQIQHLAWAVHFAIREMVDEMKIRYQQQKGPVPKENELYDQVQAKIFPMLPSEVKSAFRHQQRKE